MSNRFMLNETSYHGHGAIQNIVPEIRARGFQRILVCTDESLVRFGVSKKVTDLLDAGKVNYHMFTEIKPNPTIENVLAGVKAAKEFKADAIVAIGGGSSMDTAKAIGIIINNPEFEDVRSLEGVAPTKKPCLPIIAVATTAGTAAEVTINYVITDVQKKRKFVCVDGGAWEMSDMFHIKAIELIAKNLRDSVAGDDKGGENMALAQYIAGMGFSNVGLGIDHAMAHTLSAYYDVPHGKACAMLLPISMEFNRDYTGEKYREIARVFGVKGVDNMSQEEYRDAAIKAVRQLSVDVGIPTRCEEIKEADLDALAKDALADACYPGNPREATHAQVVEMFKKLM